MPLAMTSVQTRIPLQTQTDADPQPRPPPPSPPPSTPSSPLEFAEVGKDAVAFVLHLPVNAADRNFPDEQLQSAAVEFHAGARAAATGHAPLPQAEHQDQLQCLINYSV